MFNDEILLTYESWCIPSEGEIPVLNKLAREYGDLMDFVVLSPPSIADPIQIFLEFFHGASIRSEEIFGQNFKMRILQIKESLQESA